jgi:hypothetical protein
VNADPEYPRCSGCGTPERECVCFGICEVCLLLWCAPAWTALAAARCAGRWLHCLPRRDEEGRFCGRDGDPPLAAPQGQRALIAPVELFRYEIEALVRRGLLTSVQMSDRGEVGYAVAQLVERVLGRSTTSHRRW